MLRGPGQGPSGSPCGSAPALPVGLRLELDQFVWCKLLRTNVILTSKLHGPTRLLMQLPDRYAIRCPRFTFQ